MTNPAYRQSRDGGMRYSQNPAGHQQVTISTVAVTLVPPALAITRIMVRGTTDVRWRDDGVDPTASAGFPLLAGEVLILDSAFDDLRFIRAGAVDSVLSVAWWNW